MGYRSILPALIFNSVMLAPGPAAAQNVPRTIDPPGFGVATLAPSEVVKLNVVCFPHPINEFPPDPCHGTLMFHDRAGNVLGQRQYDLQPGESAFLVFAPSPSDFVALRVGIIPCVIPEPGGRAIPSAEVIDRRTRHVVRYMNPVAARMFGSDDGGSSGPSDSPGFGLVTMGTDQVIRLNVVCFEHGNNGFPPDPCSGALMLHDAAGRDLLTRRVDLQPGETAFIQFALPAAAPGGLVGIDPCWVHVSGGPAAPDVEVFDRATGDLALYVGPVVARVTQLDAIGSPR
jgi:hypothetical protein